MQPGTLFNPIAASQVDIPETGVNAFVNIVDGTLWGKFSDGSVAILYGLTPLTIFDPTIDYWLVENFDKGFIPSGWTQSTNGATTVNYTQAYENGHIGQVQMIGNGPAALRAAIGFANTFNYILNFADCLYTKWNHFVRKPSTDGGVSLVGLANRIDAATPASFNNVIAIVHDPNNMTGANPGLITNWIVLIKNATGQSVYNTNVAPTGIWQFVEFEYNYENPLAPYVDVKIDGILKVTVLGTDPNLFVSQAPAANAGLKPVIYNGKTAALSVNNSIRVDNFNLGRKWN